ncbi:MAG: hypothetical protein DYG83_13440 [Candidatus Brocadia sp. AMX2]|uniref:Phage tail tape measure protein TP901 family n=1 Tax=Candidatus Brocadia sinica JPN1 TaxID=1197129 RepID=A0ABQ0JYY2_9BACT|nr:hypothetical protein [Candidatus Brocadia sp.]MBL1168522.1 hypothetical protein [Candidatus Brocadia sp. AMX1]MCE7867795.1 hypothetical protein [Candidatus Brocadia sp. AMX2]GAN33979.1 phage tail tape measure protein TP901 family [Candidatus Brocadia sinica JPN1]GIK14248.1 MAG: hypothetical protein BroJett002_29550 [Candidatus Brocadia sinica]
MALYWKYIKSQNLLIHTYVIDKITLFPVIDIPAFKIFPSQVSNLKNYKPISIKNNILVKYG